MSSFQHGIACTVIQTLYDHFYFATFVWVFVEGLYLFMIVYFAFLQLNIALYIAIGYGMCRT